MSDYDIARELANLPASLHAIADALLQASNWGVGMDAAGMGELVECLCDHEAFVDAAAIPQVMIALAALFAAKTNAAPKQIWEQLWKDAPTDQWWRERLTRGGRDGGD